MEAKQKPNNENNRVYVDWDGYGRIYRGIMQNASLPILSKVIYSYIQAFIGNQAGPSPRKTEIVKDLGISLNTVDKYMRILVDRGYIIRHRKPKGTEYEMVYTIPHPYKKNELMDAKALGLGQVSRIAMTDPRLSAFAKGLYAYISSFMGDGGEVLLPIKQILKELGIGKELFYKIRKVLLDTGYITLVQTKEDNGEFAPNYYSVSSYINDPPHFSSEEYKMNWL